MLDKTTQTKKNIAAPVVEKVTAKRMQERLKGIKMAGGPIKLDIGCGERKLEGHIGMDIAMCEGVDIVGDVRQTPWAFESESVDSIYTSHFFEHLDGPARVAFMEECWRVLKVGAQMVVICPYWSSMRAVGDPFHKWPPVCEWTFFYFVEHWRNDNKLDHYGIKCNFNWSCGHAVNADLVARSDDYRTMARKNYINSINDIHVTLTKVELGKRS